MFLASFAVRIAFHVFHPIIPRRPEPLHDGGSLLAEAPSPRTDPCARREAYRTRLFRHACDVASASRAAIAFSEVGAVRSVQPTRSGQPLRSGHGCLCRLRMPVSPLSRSGARRTVPMTERPREAARPLPARILRFPHLRRRGRPTSARPPPASPIRPPTRDWRQAMPRAEPALSLTPLHLPAVIGAAIRTGITTPVTPGVPPPQSGGHTPEGCPARKRGQGALGAGGCAGTTTLRLPQGKPWG